MVVVMVGQSVVSDEAWALVEPLLPSSVGRRGGRWRSHRQVVEGIAWRYRTGCPWRDLPVEFGPWQTVWHRHNQWAADGTWDRILVAVQGESDLVGELEWVASVDSSIMRAHQHAAGAGVVDPGHTGGGIELQGSDTRAR